MIRIFSKNLEPISLLFCNSTNPPVKVKMSEINDKSLSFGKFLRSPGVGAESSLFRSWLQNRLREYALRTEKLQGVSTNDIDWSTAMQPTGDVHFHELRVIGATSDPNFHAVDIASCRTIARGLQSHTKEHIHDKAYRRVKVSLQRKGPHSPLETLELLIFVEEVVDLELCNLLVHPFCTYAGKHAIDVTSNVLPTLQAWIDSKKVQLKLPIPTCYFGKYEYYEELNIERHWETNDDVISKVGVALKKESDADGVLQSYRVLILNDMLREGFQQRNSKGTPFMPLLTVMAGVNEVAKIHAAYWAFTKQSNTKVCQNWGFLENKHFMPYLKTLLDPGLKAISSLSEDYLTQINDPDKLKILEYLTELEANLEKVLDSLNPLKSFLLQRNAGNQLGPLTLIHQSLNFSTILFRHRLNPTTFRNLLSTESKAETSARKSKPESDEVNLPSSSSKSFFPIIDRESCIINWQNASLGYPYYDIAFFLLTSLLPQTRRDETQAILQSYAESFEQTALILGLSKSNLTWKWEDLTSVFWKGILFGCLLMASNVNSDSVVPEADILIFVEAIRDLISQDAELRVREN